MTDLILTIAAAVFGLAGCGAAAVSFLREDSSDGDRVRTGARAHNASVLLLAVAALMFALAGSFGSAVLFLVLASTCAVAMADQADGATGSRPKTPEGE